MEKEKRIFLIKHEKKAYLIWQVNHLVQPFDKIVINSTTQKNQAISLVLTLYFNYLLAQNSLQIVHNGLSNGEREDKLGTNNNQFRS